MGKVRSFRASTVYNTYMRRALLPLLFVALITFVPLSAQAATFFGPIIPEECHCENETRAGGATIASAPDWGCVMQTVQNLMNFAVSISIIFIILAIVYAGASFMLAGTNAHQREAGKKMIANAVIGTLVVLSAWLVVDFIMKVLYDSENPQFGPWNELLAPGNAPRCFQVRSAPPPLPGIAREPEWSGGGSTAGGNTGAGGSCSIPTSAGNPCSVQTLQSTCFGSRAQDAARICSLESAGGNPRAESGSDRLINERGRPAYSIGLWQINLTVHQVAGLNCPAAFTQACAPGNGSLVGSSQPGACRARIRDWDLYNQCKEAAKNPRNNSAVACRLYSQSGANGGFQPWAYSANRCNVQRR